MNTNPLIPRRTLFGNPEKTKPSISPDGTKLAYCAPSKKGILNIWIKTLGEKDDVQITDDGYRGIRSYFWAFNNTQIIYTQDKGGDENWRIFAVDITSRTTKDLTPFDKTRAQNILTDRDHPNHIMAGLNKRNASCFDMYKIDLKTGTMEMVAENPGDVGSWGKDNNFIIRTAEAIEPESGDTILRIRQSQDTPWRELLRVPFGEIFSVHGFANDNKTLFVELSLNSDTTKLVLMDSLTGEILEEIASNPLSDIVSVIKNHKTHELQAVGFNYLRQKWQFFDKKMERDFYHISKQTKGDLYLTSRDKNDTIWIVAVVEDNHPYSYYIFDRKNQSLTFLFTTQPALLNYELCTMKPVIITSRDGLKLVSYITFPGNDESRKHPLVLLVHGGPWSRDHWSFDPITQWLSNRGYAVLQVNFRSSTGFGKSFLNAGNGEWGVGKMQHDLTDSVEWAVTQGFADKEKIAIMGGSYGGYATLAGLAFTPDLYACGIDIVGPSNLKTLLGTIPEYWKPFRNQMILRIGDIDNDEKLNESISPLFHVEKIKAPLLIGQGANDPRVKMSESDQIVSAMRKKNIPVTYIVYSDEGHGFARPENRLDFYGRVEEFLAANLGGLCEPAEKSKGSKGEEK